MKIQKPIVVLCIVPPSPNSNIGQCRWPIQNREYSLKTQLIDSQTFIHGYIERFDCSSFSHRTAKKVYKPFHFFHEWKTISPKHQIRPDPGTFSPRTEHGILVQGAGYSFLEFLLSFYLPLFTLYALWIAKCFLNF